MSFLPVILRPMIIIREFDSNDNCCSYYLNSVKFCCKTKLGTNGRKQLDRVNQLILYILYAVCSYIDCFYNFFVV